MQYCNLHSIHNDAIGKYLTFRTLRGFVDFSFPGMRTARNIFIATLAFADVSLCFLGMPMTLLGILTKYWPFGPQTWLLCKIVRTTPAVMVFFSSYTVVVIAADRHRFIVQSTKRQVKILHTYFFFCIKGFHF